MASKAEWKDALQDLATFADVGYMEPGNGRLSGIRERLPHDLAHHIADGIEEN